MRDEFLNMELFETWYEVEVLTRGWIRYYNEERPHSSLGYRPLAIQAKVAWNGEGRTLDGSGSDNGG